MKNQKKDKKLIGAGVVTAIAASLCCITPVLALFAGASGFASTFSWIEPFRPYLMWITILVLAFAWYHKLKPVKQEDIDCACEEDEKPSFWQSKKFLGIVTVFAALMLAFPHYSYIFYPENKSNIVQNAQSDITESIFKVEGMTCESCNQHVEHEVSLLPGYVEAIADYKTGIVKVKYDKSKSSEDDVVNSVNKTGYKIIDTIIAEGKELSLQTIEVKVKGLTCESCDRNLERQVGLLPGYIEVLSDFNTGLVKVKYDSSKNTEKEVMETINNTGYKITDTISTTNEKPEFSSLEVNVKGLTCKGCSKRVEQEIALLPGYMEAIANHKTGKVQVKFDTSKSSKETIVAVINKTGFKVMDTIN